MLSRRGFAFGVLAASSLLAACLIQRPAVPPEFLGLRYEVLDSTTAAAQAFLAGDTVAQRLVRERLPEYARHVQVDTLVSEIEADPRLTPLGARVRVILEEAAGRTSGRVRDALRHPDAQRELVSAVVLGLGKGLRRAREERPQDR